MVVIAQPSSLDLSRLENVRQSGNKIIARCPACAELDRDRKLNNFVLFPTGAFHCQAFPRDREHNTRIKALVGIPTAWIHDPEKASRRKQQIDAEQRRARDQRRLIHKIREKRAAIIARHPWNPADVWEDSPQRIDQALVETDPRWFLGSIFPMDALVWTGEVFHSGLRHADHWRTVREWQDTTRIGPMTTPAVWKPGTVSRIGENVQSSPYVVCDFDGFDDRKPETKDEINRHFHDSLALIRWLREGLRWELAAMVWTGSKSIHAWFRTPPPAAIQSLRNTAAALGIDAGLVGHPEHPCRLPGQIHAKTGRVSQVLWLQNPEE